MTYTTVVSLDADKPQPVVSPAPPDPPVYGEVYAYARLWSLPVDKSPSALPALLSHLFLKTLPTTLIFLIFLPIL